MSFALYKRLLPPTAVDHAVTASVTGEKAVELVVARGCVLSLYAVRTSLQAEDDKLSRIARLDLLAEYELSGIVQSLAVVRLPQAKTDSVIVSFAEAKVAVVDWDPFAFSLKTVSLHFYENEPSLKSGRTQFLVPQTIRVDYDNRCAVVLLYDRHLAVIPFISDSQHPDVPNATVSKPASSYLVDLQKLGIINIKDFQFINGYYEPTLMFVFEPDRTWAGRYVKKKNTCSAAIISLHVLQKAHTIIWKLDKLPHDCHTIVPLSPPAGGALVLSFNEAVYLNQSSSLYRLSLNHFGDLAQAADGGSHTKERSRTPVCFEAARYTFLDDDTLLVSTYNGDLFALTVVTDGRTVTHIDVQKAGSASLASCMTTITHDLLFLGSRQGDSYLIRFSVKSLTTESATPSSTSSTAQADIIKDFIDPDDFDADVADLVDVMVHSKKARLLSNQRAQFPKWALQVCDVLPSLAAVSSVTLERSLDTLDVEGETSARTESKFLELVCASGRGKSGSLSVVQQAIRPSVVTSLELPGCQAVWSVFHSTKSSNSDDMAVDNAVDDDNNFQKYLIISRPNSTMVLETGEAISEVTNDAEFRVDAPTLNAANMFGRSRYVQVHEGGFYLVDGLRPAQIESLPEGVRVVWSSICDPYLMTILSDDTIQLFVASGETGRLKQLNVTLDVATNPISTCCVFQDTSSVMPFNRTVRSTTDDVGSAAEPAMASIADGMSVDDEEDKQIAQDPEEVQLYGISSRKAKKRARSAEGQNEASHDVADSAFLQPEQIERPYYAAIARSNGSLEIYELPSFKLVWHCAKGLCDGSSTLLCEPDLVPNSSIFKHTKMPVEIAFVPLGSTHLSATLVVLYDTGELSLFRSFTVPSASSGALRLGLKRLHSEVLCHNLRKPGGGIAEAIAAAQAAALKAQQQAARAAASGTTEDGIDADDAVAEENDDEDEEMEAVAEGVETRVILPHRSRWTHHRIIRFDNVQGRSGVFVCGVRPIWLYCERDHVRTFLMDLDGPVQAFTPFNNVNCSDGFIYYASSSAKLKISQQKPGWSYELPLPILRVPLRATPVNVAYDPENETLVVLLSNTVKDTTRWIRPAADDKKDKDREEELRERGIDPASIQYRESDVPPRMPPMFDEKLEIRLINTADWQTTDSYELLPEEVGTVSRLFLKTSESDYAEVKQYPFIVLVTSTIRGEDASCKGRICIFEINKESAAGAAPVSKLNLLVNKEQKGPVSACTSVDGTLSVAVAQKIYFWQLKNKRDLDMIGFHDTQFLVTNMVGVKKFLIVTDMYDSIFFMRWRDRVRTCDHLGKDSDHMGATAAGFMIDHEKMSMLIADGKNNVNMYVYDPKNLATQKGQKLLCLGNFHMGVYTTQFIRVKLNRLNFPALGNQFPKYGCLSGATDGSVSLFAPINADKFKRLGKLEIRLVSTLPHFCGLNPKAFRLWKPRWHYTHNHQRRFIDGNLIWKFAELDRATQESLANFTGVSVQELLDDLMELELATRLF